MLMENQNKNPQLCYVPLDQVKYIWSTAWNFLALAVDKAGEMTEEDLLGEIAKVHMHLFMVNVGGTWVGAFTVRISREAQQTAAIIVHLGGDVELMYTCFEELSSWARAYGADRIRFYGRKGWRHRAKRYGFLEKYVVMEAPI